MSYAEEWAKEKLNLRVMEDEHSGCRLPESKPYKVYVKEVLKRKDISNDEFDVFKEAARNARRADTSRIN